MMKNEKLRDGYEWRTTENNYVPMIYCLKCEKKNKKPYCLGTNKSAASYHELQEHLFTDLKEVIEKLPDEAFQNKKKLKSFDG